MPFFDQYPYTNFHNVNLDWILERVKEWGELVEQNNIAFHNLEEANEAFKEYVTNYLQNLDVQEEINIKLDSLLEDGTLVIYLRPYVSTSVTDWLEDNITEPEGIIIDNSLTVAGAAADSKAVGDKIADIEADIETFTITEAAKRAILDCFSKVAWTVANGQTYYNILETALNAGIERWTYQWNYTDGLPNNKGMHLVYTGNSTATLTENGLLMSAEDTSGKYIEYYYSDTDTSALYVRGAFEFIFTVNSWGSYNQAPYGNGVKFYLGLGARDGNRLKCPELTINQSGITHLVASGNSMTWEVISNTTFELNREYKIECTETLEDTKVYVDGALVAVIPYNTNYEELSSQAFIAYRGVNVTFKRFRFKLYTE